MRVLLLLLLISSSLALTLEPRQFNSSTATIQLEYSDTVAINGGTLRIDGATDRTLPSSAFTGSGATWEITLENLLPGNYELEVQRGQSDYVTFEYYPTDNGLNVHITNLNVLAASNGTPTTAFASQVPYDVTFTTTEAATCKYGTNTRSPDQMVAFDSSAGTTHSLSSKSWKQQLITVWCNATSPITKQFLIGYETSAPNFSVTLDPPLVVDPLDLNVNFSVDTVDTIPPPLFCEAVDEAGLSTPFSSFSRDKAAAYRARPWAIVSPPNEIQSQEAYTVTCTNRAGLSSSIQVNVSMNLTATGKVTRITPGAFSNTNTPILGVQVEKGGLGIPSTCSFIDNTEGTFTSDGVINNVQLSTLPDTRHSFSIRCVTEQGERVDGNVSFTVDTHNPPAPTPTFPPFVCGNESLYVEMDMGNLTPDTNFDGYQYTISTADVLLQNKTSRSSTIVSSLSNLTVGTRYFWSIYPIDLARNRGSEITGWTEYTDMNDTRCDKQPPIVLVNLSKGAGYVNVSLQCTDNNSGCADQFKYGWYPGESPGVCEYNMTDNRTRQGKPTTIPFFADGTFCYQVYDVRGNTVEGRSTISVGSFSPSIVLYEPEGFANTSTVHIELGVEASGQPIDASSCRFADDLNVPFTKTGMRFAADVPNLPEQLNVRNVSCALLNGERIQGTIEFVKDTFAPTDHDIFAPSTMCEGNPIRVQASHDGDAVLDKNFAGYQYLLTFDVAGATFPTPAQNVRVHMQGTTEDANGLIEYNGDDIVAGQTFKWQIVPVDAANNYGDLMQRTTTIVSRDNPDCDQQPPNASVVVTPQDVGATVQVQCSDDNSGCRESYEYELLPLGSTLDDCSFAESRSYADGGIPLWESAVFCYRATDNMLNERVGVRTVSVTDVDVSLDVRSPGTYVTSRQVPFEVQPMVDNTPVAVDSCSIDGTEELTASNTLFTGTVNYLEGGPYTAEITCIVGGSPIEETITFTVDTIAPSNHELLYADSRCEGQSVTAKASRKHQFDPDPNFLGYEYNVTYAVTGGSVLASGLSDDGSLSFDDAELGEEYTWHVWPVDKAGNRGEKLTGTFEMLAQDDPACDYDPPIGSASIQPTDQGVSVIVSCDDTQSCKSEFSYSVLDPDASECTYEQSAPLEEPIPVSKDALFCYAVYDEQLNNDTGSESISITGGGSCSNDVQDASETGVDCGGACPACVSGGGCGSNRDCQSGYCNAFFECEEASCSDGIKNGLESGVDCGGSCESCQGNGECSSGLDCASGICNAGLCEGSNVGVIEDADGDQIPDAWEEQWGLDPSNPADGSEDPDGDGITNREEYELGSDPFVPNERPSQNSDVQSPGVEEGISILGIVFIVAGLVVMGGSGYWLYAIHEPPEPPSTQPPPQRPQGISPQQRQAMAQQRKQQEAAMQRQRELAAKRAADKAAERKKLMSAFDGGKTEAPKEKPSSPKEQEGYVDIAKKPKKPKKSAFEDLDKLIGEKK